VRAKVVAVEPNTQCLPVLHYHFQDNPAFVSLRRLSVRSPGKRCSGFTGLIPLRACAQTGRSRMTRRCASK
jgi:hypothetical protein